MKQHITPEDLQSLTDEQKERLRKAQGKPNTKAWYEANKDKMQLHPETRKWIETVLGVRP